MGKLRFDEEEHKYYEDEVNIPSVTTILNPSISKNIEVGKNSVSEAMLNGTIIHKC